MRWRPTGDQIYVRPLLTSSKSAGGIEIPDDARGRPQRGIIVAVGPGSQSELSGIQRKMEVQEGDLAMFGQFAGMNEEFVGDAVIIMRDQEVLGRVPAEEFTVVSHTNSRGRTVYHLSEDTCDDCPKDAPADLSAERERLRAEKGGDA